MGERVRANIWASGATGVASIYSEGKQIGLEDIGMSRSD
jgi:hypothetical protein